MNKQSRIFRVFSLGASCNIILIFLVVTFQYLLNFGIANVYAYQNHVQHSGDVIVADSEVLVVGNTKYSQYGDVLVKDNGNLTIVNSSFCMASENRTYVTLLDSGTLKVVNSELTSLVHVLHFRCYNNSKIFFENTVLSFWGSTVIELLGNSIASLEDSGQKKGAQLETNDASTATVKNSTLYLVQSSGSSTVFLQDSNVTSGSSCEQCATLILKHSNLQKWLDVDGSSKLIASERSVIGTLWPRDSSNVTTDNSHIGWLYPQGSPVILLTNGSSVKDFKIEMPPGISIISGIRKGYNKNCVLNWERTGFTINIHESSVDSLDLDVGSNSHLFLENCNVGTLSVSKYGSVTVYNSEVETIYCGANSFVIMWNSKTSYPRGPSATIRYVYTVPSVLFYIVLVIAIILALALIFTVRGRRKKEGLQGMSPF